MPTSVELRQQRAQVVESMRAITDTAENENRDLDGTEREQYNRHETDFTSLTERINRQEALERREADAARSIPPGPGNDGLPANDPEQRARDRRSAFTAFIRRGAATLAPEQRALIENTAGEILVPEDLEAEILRTLPEITIVRGLASQRTIATNRVRRRSLGEVTVGWGKLETGGQTLTDSMPDTPTEEYTYIEDLYGLAKIGEDEFDDTDANLEAFVRDSFSRAIGEAEDTGFVVGAGHSVEQPVGFMTTLGGVPTVAGSSATDVTIDDFKRLIYATPAQYRRNAAFITASANELVIATKKDENGAYLWQPSVQAGRPNTFLGYALHNQEDVAAIGASANVAAFGDWNAGYRVYDRLGMTVQRLVELYAEEGMIGFKARARVTGDVIRPDALRILRTAAA